MDRRGFVKGLFAGIGAIGAGFANMSIWPGPMRARLPRLKPQVSNGDEDGVIYTWVADGKTHTIKGTRTTVTASGIRWIS